MQTSHRTAIVWFRRGLRVHDNRALTEALRHSQEVVPVFVLDPLLLTHPTTAPIRVRFLIESLEALDGELRKRGGQLILRHGKPVEELSRLVRETGATAIYHGREYEPYGRDRDAAVLKAMSALGVTIQETSDHLISEPEAVMTKAGSPYTVFTPYKRVWWEEPVETPLPAPDRIPMPKGLRSEPLPPSPGDALVRGGETEGARRWERFVAEDLGDYDVARDFPGREGTTRLSAYLKFGAISARQMVADARERRAQLPPGKYRGADVFLSELAWRDFYYQILFHFPHVATGAFKTAYNGVVWENDETLFEAWSAGRTGYPIVDAAIRQLNTEGWMHNRARMITASFLTKDLLCDWRRGERVFMQRLIDGDQAANNGGWQWAAGTGTDAQPYFRIFNPVTQGEKFDPDGGYVKRWVPELARVPVKFIHKPWELSAAEQSAIRCVLGRDYPFPVVDHRVQRERALKMYRAATGGAPPSDSIEE